MKKIRLHTNDTLNKSLDGWLSYTDSMGETIDFGYDPESVINWASQEGIELTKKHIQFMKRG